MFKLISLSFGRGSAIWSVLSVGAGLSFLLSPGVSADVLEGDQFFRGDKTIPAGTMVKGNVTVIDGTLRVLGTVEGNIIQKGFGGVVVDGSAGEGIVTGDVEERNAGSVEFINGAMGERNIKEYNDGRVLVLESLLKGNIHETGNGNVRILSSTLEGNIKEQNYGEVFVFNNSTVEGNVVAGPGEVNKSANSTIKSR